MGKRLVWSRDRSDEFKDAVWDDNCPYLWMTDAEINQLPRFMPDGTVALYDLGRGYLLGKSGLERFRKTWADKVNKDKIKITNR